MFRELLAKKQMSIAELAKTSGVGYNYVFKIINNQTDFNRCGIGVAKKLADALGTDLNHLYEYQEQWENNKIYYQDQTGWTVEMYGLLNAEINKLFLIGIEYHFSQAEPSRSIKACKAFDREIRSIKYEKLSDETKCIMVAILNQQEKLKEFVQIYKNLAGLVHQKPLQKTLFLADEPYNIFPSYIAMNIEY